MFICPPCQDEPRARAGADAVGAAGGSGADAPISASQLLGRSNLYANRTELHEALGDAWAASGGVDSARAHYRIVADAWANGDPPVKARAARAAAQPTRGR
jgi:hypothetical protein